MCKLRPMSICLFILAAIGCCSAELLVVDSEASGWYDHRGYSLGFSSNWVGQSYLMGKQYQNASYFIFSIPELTQEITAVQLVMELTNYYSDDPSEDIRISGVSTPAEELVGSHTGLNMSPSTYKDLVMGPELGILTVDTGGILIPFLELEVIQNDGKGPLFSCSFNDVGLQLINDAIGGTFAIGLSLIDVDAPEVEYVAFSIYLGDPDYCIHQLHITTVPEPSSMLLLLGSVFFFRKRNNDR